MSRIEILSAAADSNGQRIESKFKISRLF